MNLVGPTDRVLSTGQTARAPLLLQAALSWWSEVSPYSGWGSTLALLFVLVVAGIKALWEDRKRHQEDRETNNSITHVMQPDGEQ